MEFYYRWGSTGGSTKDCNNNDEVATAWVALPAPSRDDNAAPPDHLLRSWHCRGDGVAMPALRSCWGVDNGKEGQCRCWACQGVVQGATSTRWWCRIAAFGVWVVERSVFPGQESISVRLKKGSDSQHVVGGGAWHCAGVGGGTETATVDVVCVCDLGTR